MNETSPTSDKLQPGFNCPVCSFYIEVTNPPFADDPRKRCPGCGTEFSMDKKESPEDL
jgi:transposase-like protein